MALKIGTLLLVAFTTIRADTVELKTGERIEGRFKQATEAGAVIDIGGQLITFPLDKVRAIYLGAAPNATAKAGSSTAEALDALKALQSVTTSGVSYRDYAPRVLDAKVRVDKYLSGSGEGDAPNTAIRLAMQYYELASTAWGAKIAQDYNRSTEFGRTLRSDPALMECSSVKAVIADADASAARISEPLRVGKRTVPSAIPPRTPAQTAETALMFAGTRVGEQPVLLWSCAASKIAEAEKR